MQSTDLVIITTTCPTEQCATSIATSLVEQKLAACAQISPPITSIYRWEGEVCEELEYRLELKCQHGHFEQICQQIESLHPYELPEIIAQPIKLGSTAYLNWIKESTAL